MQKLLVLLAMIMVLALLPGAAGASGEPHPGWETLADGSKVYGFWQDSGGYRFLIECDPATGQMTGFAYLNSGKYVEQEVQVLDGYDQVKYIDTSQPKRYLYSPEMYPPRAKYRGESLSIRQGTEDPVQVGYPYGSSLAEDWRPVIVPIYNPNRWGVKAWVHAFLTGDDWQGYVTLGPQETKWVMLKIPANAKIGGYNPYSSAYITVVTRVVENYDPLAPDEYKVNPPADNSSFVMWYADLRGLEFSGPEWYDERDTQKVLVLEPAFKEVMQWIPDNPGDWRVGHPEYDTVPGYRWVTKEVNPPNPLAGYPTSLSATQDDINNLRAAGEGNGPYYQTEGTTLKIYDKTPIYSWQDEGFYRYIYRYYYKSRVVFYNNQDFYVTLDNFYIAAKQKEGKESRWRQIPVGISGTLAPGETKEFYVYFTQDDGYFDSEYGYQYQRILSPYLTAGNIFNGIGGIKMVTSAAGNVTVNAVAGAENYCEEDDWQDAFEPSLRVTLFDFEEVMTPDELARFAAYEGGQILRNITNFLAGHPERMEVTAYYNNWEDLRE